jgi:hypothetical protein
MGNSEVYEYVKQGYRLKRAPNCPDFLYEIMKMCWDTDADARPTAGAVLLELADHLNKTIPHDDIESMRSASISSHVSNLSSQSPNQNQKQKQFNSSFSPAEGEEDTIGLLENAEDSEHWFLEVKEKVGVGAGTRSSGTLPRAASYSRVSFGNAQDREHLDLGDGGGGGGGSSNYSRVSFGNAEDSEQLIALGDNHVDGDGGGGSGSTYSRVSFGNAEDSGQHIALGDNASGGGGGGDRSTYSRVSFGNAQDSEHLELGDNADIGGSTYSRVSFGNAKGSEYLELGGRVVGDDGGGGGSGSSYSRVSFGNAEDSEYLEDSDHLELGDNAGGSSSPLSVSNYSRVSFGGTSPPFSLVVGSKGATEDTVSINRSMQPLIEAHCVESVAAAVAVRRPDNEFQQDSNFLQYSNGFPLSKARRDGINTATSGSTCASSQSNAMPLSKARRVDSAAVSAAGASTRPDNEFKQDSNFLQYSNASFGSGAPRATNGKMAVLRM